MNLAQFIDKTPLNKLMLMHFKNDAENYKRRFWVMNAMTI